ncbi:MAG: ketoacyl-ACP synthase III [Actinomycetota bacterium]|nr:ketoacyl-ACP synthase III [Actinomycetota bacterium]
MFGHPSPATPNLTPMEGELAVAVTGLGVALPEEVVSNADWAASLDTSDEWIVSRTGIRERRRAAPNEATSDLAIRAATAALADAGLDARDIGVIVVATTTPDHLVPQTAPLVAARLGLEVPAFDVGAGCSGFVYGLAVAAGLATSGLADPVLLVGAETMTRVIDPTDRQTAVLFGDGAGACILSAHAPEGTALGSVGPFDLGSDGALADALMVPAGGVREPASHETVAANRHVVLMRGREVYRHAVTRMSASAWVVLQRAGLQAADVDVLVGHQANARILAAVAQRLGIRDEQAFVCVERYGNTSAASIPIALEEARTAGRLRRGTRVLLTSFGAGLTWGSCLLTWAAAEETAR